MKRFATLAAAAILTLALAGAASALDVKTSMNWEIGMGWSGGTTFYSAKNGPHNDRFKAAHRIQPQIDFVASETLRAVLSFEIGTTYWGMNNEDEGSIGGAIDGDGRSLKTKQAYLDWSPAEALNLRMGVQFVALPSAAFGNPVLEVEVAGVIAGYTINDALTLNLFWLRPFDASAGEGQGQNLHDEMDMFGFSLLVSGENFKVTPWGAYARTGNASGYWNYRSDATGGFDLTDYTGDLSGSSNLWWAGTAAEFTFAEQFNLKLDAIYGAARGNNAPEFSGWLAAGLFEYASGEAWGKPGLIGWYASGDKGKAYNDGRYGKYGRMPVLGVGGDDGFKPTSFGFQGDSGCMTDGLLSASGVGTWGVGLQLADFTFVDKLSHVLRAVYIRGTNDADMIRGNPNAERYGEPYNIMGDFVYLTKKDYALEVDFVSTYEVNENLSVFLETGFIHLGLDHGVWGNYANTANAWKAELLFTYSF